MKTRRDTLDMGLAIVGFIVVMAILIGGGIVGYLAIPDDETTTTTNPENMTTMEYYTTDEYMTTEEYTTEKHKTTEEYMTTGEFETTEEYKTTEEHKTTDEHKTTEEYMTTEDDVSTSSSSVVEKLPSNLKCRPSLEDNSLPSSLNPVHYLVRLQPFVSGNFSVLGYVEVELEVLEPTSNITLHMADIITHNDTITVRQDGEAVVIRQHVYDARRQWYVAKLDRELRVDHNVVVSLSFTGVLSDQPRGFTRSSYLDSSGDTVMLAVSMFGPTGARRAFPCLDEPESKAKFTVSLAREQHMTALSTMPTYATELVSGQPGWVWEHFTTTPPIYTHTLAFIIFNFIQTSNTYGDVDISVWAQKTVLHQASYALDTGAEALAFFENYFDIPFLLPKLDLVSTVGVPEGDKDTQGLVTIRAAQMLYDPRSTSAANKQEVRSTVVHRLTHQWLADLLTSSCWDDAWINEGLASYLEYVGTSHLEPEWEMVGQLVVDSMHNMLALDSMESSPPLRTHITATPDNHHLTDDVISKKGASIIRMLNHILTEDTFRKGLTSYLSRVADTQDDLWHFLTEAGREDDTLADGVTVKTVMDTWTRQPGYPVITVTRSAEGSTATITQERFLAVRRANGEATEEQDQYRWWVPLTLTSADELDFSQTQPSYWMEGGQQEVTLTSLPAKDKWVIFNLQEMGYYRVNYDDDNWALIADQLRANHAVINVINRAQIIDDTFNFAREGRLSYERALGMIAYMSREAEYIPWKAALSNLDYIDKMFARTPGYGALKRYVLSLLTPLYDSVGFEDDLRDLHTKQLLRRLELPWSCRLGHRECVDQAVKQFEDWSTTGSFISPNLESTVYCMGVAAGEEEEWDQVWRHYLLPDLTKRKDHLLAALSCSSKPWILSRYLDVAFTEGGGVSKQDSALVFASVAATDVGHTIAWSFLRNQWQRISQYYNESSTLSDLVTTATAGFNTEAEKHQLEVFYVQHGHNMGDAAPAVQQALVTTEKNIAWMKNNYDTIVDWLNDHGFSRLH